MVKFETYMSLPETKLPITYSGISIYSNNDGKFFYILVKKGSPVEVDIDSIPDGTAIYLHDYIGDAINHGLCTLQLELRNDKINFLNDINKIEDELLEYISNSIISEEAIDIQNLKIEA